jgi:hypothetical protein
VLAVGVNEYWDSALHLSFASPDAKTLSDGLKQAGTKLYERIEIKTVLDADATAEKLDGVFSELSKQVRPQDVFVFFLAGHGKTVDARFYFLPQDFRYAGEDSIIKKGHGVFTYTLLAGLDAADANGDGVIDVTELAQYVDRRLDVKSEASQAANTLSRLAPGAQVYLMRTENGWTLVARDGQKLGYVKEGALLRLQ